MSVMQAICKSKGMCIDSMRNNRLKYHIKLIVDSHNLKPLSSDVISAVRDYVTCLSARAGFRESTSEQQP